MQGHEVSVLLEVWLHGQVYSRIHCLQVTTCYGARAVGVYCDMLKPGGLAMVSTSPAVKGSQPHLFWCKGMKLVCYSRSIWLHGQVYSRIHCLQVTTCYGARVVGVYCDMLKPGGLAMVSTSPAVKGSKDGWCTL